MCLGRPEISASMPASVSALREHVHGALDVRLAGACGASRAASQSVRYVVGLEHLEGEVLELPLDLPDAQALGERRVDLGRLARDALLLLDAAARRACACCAAGRRA